MVMLLINCVKCSLQFNVNFLKWVVFVSAVTQAGKGNFAMNVGPTQAVLMELAVSHGSATVSRNGVEFFVMKVKEASVQ